SVLYKVKEPNIAQQELMNKLEREWAQRLGVSQETLAKHPELMYDVVDQAADYEESFEKIGDEALSSADKESMASDISAKNREEANIRKKNSDNEMINNYRNIVNEQMAKSDESREKTEANLEKVAEKVLGTNEIKTDSDLDYVVHYQDTVERIMELTGQNRETTEEELDKILEVNEETSEGIKESLDNIVSADDKKTKEIISNLDEEEAKLAWNENRYKEYYDWLDEMFGFNKRGSY